MPQNSLVLALIFQSLDLNQVRSFFNMGTTATHVYEPPVVLFVSHIRQSQPVNFAVVVFLFFNYCNVWIFNASLDWLIASFVHLQLLFPLCLPFRMSGWGLPLAWLWGGDSSGPYEQPDAVAGAGTGRQMPARVGLRGVLCSQPRPGGACAWRGRQRCQHLDADGSFQWNKMPLYGWKTQTVFHPGLPGQEPSGRCLPGQWQPSAQWWRHQHCPDDRLHSASRRFPTGNGHSSWFCVFQRAEIWNMVYSVTVRTPCGDGAEVSNILVPPPLEKLHLWSCQWSESEEENPSWFFLQGYWPRVHPDKSEWRRQREERLHWFQKADASAGLHPQKEDSLPSPQWSFTSSAKFQHLRKRTAGTQNDAFWTLNLMSHWLECCYFEDYFTNNERLYTMESRIQVHHSKYPVQQL